MDIPWVSLVWEKHYKNGKLLHKFKTFTTVTIEDGQTCFFWTDNWMPQTPAVTAPELYSYAKNKSISVQKAVSSDIFSELFHLPVSQVAVAQMENLQSNLLTINLSDGKDKWSYTWGSHLFSVGYNMGMAHIIFNN